MFRTILTCQESKGVADVGVAYRDNDGAAAQGLEECHTDKGAGMWRGRRVELAIGNGEQAGKGDGIGDDGREGAGSEGLEVTCKVKPMRGANIKSNDVDTGQW